MNATMVSELEKHLGRQLDPAQEGTITDLRDLPVSVIADARRLGESVSSLMATVWIFYHVPYALRRQVPDFIAAVVDGDTDPKQWQFDE